MRPRGTPTSSKGLVLLWLVCVCLASWAQAESPGDRGSALLRPLARLLPGWTFGGDVDVGLSIPLGRRRDQAEGWVRISFRDGRFSNPQENMVGEGLRGTVRVGGERPSGEGIPVQAELSLSGGEVLLGHWYLEVDPAPLKIHFRGNWRPEERSLREMKGTLEWGELVRASWEGSIGGLGRRWKARLRAAVEFPSHQALFGLLVARPMAELQPEWAEASMGGQSRCLLDLQADENGVFIRGILSLEDTEIHSPAEGLEIEGLAGEIPFQLPFGQAEIGATNPGAIPDTGELRLRKAQIGAIRLEDLRLMLISSVNGLDLKEPFEVPLFGGKLLAREAKLRDIMPLPPKVHLGFGLEGLDLGDMSKALMPFELHGKVNGEFPEIVIERGALRSQGQLQMELWGGRIILQHLWGEDLFSSRRRLGIEVTMQGLNMEEATRSLQFGQMGGILEGEVKGLVFSYGQPESFELWVRSVRQPGVEQYVDAKAVENLSILSSGVKAPLLPWFKFYPYSKLGIYCKLENDIFTLKGTVVEGDKTYMVKRAFLRGINVFPPQNPTLPWKDMLGRLRRIFMKEGQKVRVQMGH